MMNCKCFLAAAAAAAAVVFENGGRKKKLSDSQIESLINYWHEERSLWDSTSPDYSDADMRNVALGRIAIAMENLDKG